MTIIFYDGSTLECSEIEFGEHNIICDGYRVIPMIEVLRIVTD